MGKLAKVGTTPSLHENGSWKLARSQIYVRKISLNLLPQMQAATLLSTIATNERSLIARKVINPVELATEIYNGVKFQFKYTENQQHENKKDKTFFTI